jgi:H2-forming N5,N10-methylenetetrahydromethanopterin dehydrogenase-like enzyme
MEKEVFERLLKEFTEVNERANKLKDFILDEEKIKTVDNLNKDLLIAQLKAMEAYLSVLSIRIGLNAPREMVEAVAPKTEETPAEEVKEGE